MPVRTHWHDSIRLDVLCPDGDNNQRKTVGSDRMRKTFDRSKWRATGKV